MPFVLTQDFLIVISKGTQECTKTREFERFVFGSIFVVCVCFVCFFGLRRRECLSCAVEPNHLAIGRLRE